VQLLTTALREQLPRLGATANDSDPLLRAKFFTPDGGWTWYASEFDGDDIFFGYVIGVAGEWGSFRLSELQTVRGGLGLPVERDRHFEPCRFSALGV